MALQGLVSTIDIARPQDEVFAYVTVQPLDAGALSRVRIELDFEGHGIGKLLVPLVVRRQARTEMPANCARLKQQLEARASPRLCRRRHHRRPLERRANSLAARLPDATP